MFIYLLYVYECVYVLSLNIKYFSYSWVIFKKILEVARLGKLVMVKVWGKGHSCTPPQRM